MNSIVRIFNYRFYVKEILVLLFTFLMVENIFNWIFIRNSIIIEGFTKILSILIYGFMLYSFNNLKKNERIIVIIFSLFMVKLVLESLFLYDSFFKQLTMYIVLAPILYVFFIKYILRAFELDLLEFMAKFYLITYIVFMALFGRGFGFGLEEVVMDDYGPFSGDSRVMHASHVFMMIVPLLWYLHQYLLNRRMKYLLPFLFVVVVIILHQHRSVWSSALLSLALYFFIAMRNRLVNLGKTAGLFVNGVLLSALVLFFVSNLVPGFLDFLSERFSEIFNPAKEGSTGNFRIEQREVYGAMFLQRPIFGWSFEGFEMENPLVDWWPSGTGQHFHEGYMEMLFYHGILGLLLKYGVLLYIAWKSFSRRLSEQSVILIAFCVAALLFSFNYVLPMVFWAFVGMCLYHLEKDKEEDDDDVLDYEMV
ncbi:MAG TPA: O-antigen ligase family protein [Flavisolibacter sp.]